MATIYLALNRNRRGQAARQNGTIVGMSRVSEADLRAKFPGAQRYDATVDDASNRWDADCEPGWELQSGRVRRSFQRNNLETLIDIEIPATYDQLDAWARGLIDEQGGFPDSKRAIGHDLLYRMRGGMYLVCNDDSTYDVNQRLAFVRAIRMGAADITSVADFYRLYTGTSVDGWISWVQPADATRVNLADVVTIMGVVPDTVNLAFDAWREDISA